MPRAPLPARLTRVAARPGASWAEIAFDAGYSDQPHFNRGFRALAGLSPRESVGPDRSRGGDRGIYQQIDNAERATRVRSRAALIRQARLIATVTDILYDFLQVDVRIDAERPDSLEIVYREAGPFPEVLRYTTEGFRSQVNRRPGSDRRWTREHGAPDVATSRLSLPDRLAGD